MARKKSTKKRKVTNYTHDKKERLNNPPVGLVTPDTDRDEGDKTYAHDPHLDPQLQWAGKAEHTSFDVPTVSLHVGVAGASVTRPWASARCSMARRSSCCPNADVPPCAAIIQSHAPAVGRRVHLENF